MTNPPPDNPIASDREAARETHRLPPLVLQNSDAMSLVRKLAAHQAFEVIPTGDGRWWLSISLAHSNDGRARITITEDEARLFQRLYRPSR